MRALLLTLSCIVVSLVLQVYSAEVSAEEQTPTPFTTDRPGIGDTAYLIPQGHVQFEVGVNLQRDRTNVILERRVTPGRGSKVRRTTVSVPNTLIRIGVLEAMELRLLGGGYVYQKTSSGNMDNHDHSVSAPVIGTKLHLLEEDQWIPQTAFLLNLTLPYGSERLHPDDVTPDFKVAGNYIISDRVSWEVNLGGAWEDGVSDNITGFYTTALSVSINETVVSFAEFFGNMNGSSTHAFDAGFTYLWLPTVQFDVWGGPALTDAAADWFVAAGISYRLPQLW